jgi:hypothetical protein
MSSYFGCNFLLYIFAQPHPKPRLGPQAQASQNCEPGPRPCQAVTKARLSPAYVGLSSAGLGLQAGPCTSLIESQVSDAGGISLKLVTDVYRTLEVLPWDMPLKGPAVGLEALDLAEFLSEDWKPTLVGNTQRKSDTRESEREYIL